MANIIRPKRSYTAAAVPSGLLAGELAINAVDKKVYIASADALTNILISSMSIADHTGTTDNVAQGSTNKYYADSLARAAISSTATGLTYTSATGVFSTTSGYAIPTTASQTNWDSGYNQRLQWDGGATNLVAATGKTSLGIGNVENTALSSWLGGTNLINAGTLTTRTLTASPVAVATGNANSALAVNAAAHTTLFASSQHIDVNLNLNRIVNFNTGGLPFQTAINISAPTYTTVGASSTISTEGGAATVQIESAPVAGTNLSWTYSYGLRVVTGIGTGVGIGIKGVLSQSVDMFQIVNGAGRKVSAFDFAGRLILGPLGLSSGNTNEIRFQELLANGTASVGFKAPDSIAGDVIWTLPAADGTAGQVLSTNASGILSWATPSSGSGTVTSVAALTLGTTGTDVTSTVATGTTTPVITLNIPTASSLNRGALTAADWTSFNTSYTNRISSLTVTGSSGAATLSANVLNIPNHTLAGLGGQTLSTNLTSLSGLSYVSASFLKMSAAGTFALDTSTYLTANQTVTLSGDVSGSGTTAITTTLATVPITKGGTGQITANAAANALLPAQTGNTGKYLTSNGTDSSWSTVTAGSSVTTSATAPVSPTAGNQWYDTTTGIIYTYVNDGTSSQWVQGSTATLATGVPAGGTTNQFLVKSSATDYATAWTGTLTNPTFTNYTETLYDAGTGSAFTLSLSNGTIQKFTTNANMTLTLPASTAGKSFVVMVVYGAANALTWSSPSTLKWVGGTTPTATSVTGKIDIFSFFQDGTNTYGTVYGQNF